MIPNPTVPLRWCTRADVEELLKLEDRALEWQGLSEKRLLRLLQDKTCFCLVADKPWGAGIQGYIIWRKFHSSLSVVRLVVHPECRRRKVGSHLLLSVVKRAVDSGREKVWTEVGEDRLDLQLFLQSMAFKAVGVNRDRYRFELCLPLLPGRQPRREGRSA